MRPEFDIPNLSRTLLVARRAADQFGRLSWTQLRELEVPRSTIAGWRRQGYLHRRLPGVYAVGHPGTSTEAALAEALLYAGPCAALSHATAAWWLGLVDREPRPIHVSTPRDRRSLPGVTVHARRKLDRVLRKGLPTTTVPRLLLDLAASEPLHIVRHALANAEYRRLLDVEAVQAMLGAGRPGSAALRTALERHQPRLAHTKSELERLFLEICERARLPLPEVNVRVDGWEVDALWREERVAVELDGYGNHHTLAQLQRDRRKELELRAAGYSTLRYAEEQLVPQRPAVIADIRRARES